MSNPNSDHERSGYTTPHSEYEYYEEVDSNPANQAIIDLMNQWNQVFSRKEMGKIFKDGEKIPKFDINKIVNDIQNREMDENAKNKLERELEMAEEGRKIEKRMRERKLEPTMLLQKYFPPKNFAPRDTLQDSHRSSTASRMFPKDGSKFTGTANSPSLSEFLCNMEVAQNTCRLSEKEFKDRLLGCTSGNVHEFIYNALQLDYSLDHIYRLLEQMFDSSPSSGNAKLCLYHFRAPRTFTFNHVVSQIQWLSSIAANSSPNKEVNKISLSLEGCNALFRCMPTRSADEIEKKYHEYLNEFCVQGEMPNYAVFVAYLSPLRNTFDRDLAENGCEESEMYGGLNLTTNMKKNLSRFLLNGDYIMNSPNKDKSYKSNRMSKLNKRSYYTRTVHAVSNNPPPRKPKYVTQKSFPSNKSTRGTYNINQQRFAPQPFNRNARYQNGNFNLARNQKYDGNRKRPNKLCILCNENNHFAHESCRFMKSPDGRRQVTLPTQTECSHCAQRFNIHVFHTEKLCPLKRNDPLYIKLKTDAMKRK